MSHDGGGWDSSDEDERRLAEAIRLSLEQEVVRVAATAERWVEMTVGDVPLDVESNGMPPDGLAYGTHEQAVAAAGSTPDAVGVWESDRGVHYVLRRGDARIWGPGVPNNTVRRVWRLLPVEDTAGDAGDGGSAAGAADDVSSEPTLEMPQEEAPAALPAPFGANLLAGSSSTHNQIKVEEVLKAIENEGSALSAARVKGTMDEMYKSGKLQPKEFGEYQLEHINGTDHSAPYKGFCMVQGVTKASLWPGFIISPTSKSRSTQSIAPRSGATTEIGTVDLAARDRSGSTQAARCSSLPGNTRPIT